MAKYLFTGSCTADGLTGVLAKGGSARVQASHQLAESMGGSVESMYFAFGERDFYVTVDLPDTAAAAAVAMTVSASGAANVTSTVLVTPEELDEASQRSPMHSPPGG